MKLNLLGLFTEEIAAAIHPYSLAKYRAEQIAKWMYQHHVFDFNDMTNLAQNARNLLNANFSIDKAELKAKLRSADEQTSKYLLLFKDNAAVEAVLMRQTYGNSACVSTQVGCAMNCSFCASALGGLVRNLSAGEILYQLLYINQVLASEQQHVNTVVIMGSGEPLNNYENVLRFIHLCHEPYCLNLGYRNITLSTSGIVPGIKRLAEECLPINLAISLHAPNNDIRNKIMPINQRFPIETVIAAADYYAERTGRRVTYEYTLIHEINDQIDHATELAKRIKGRLANVNLIPVNPVPERGLLRSSKSNIINFFNTLKNHRIAVTIRREMGADIQAACGQLRQRVLKNEPYIRK